MERVTVYLCYRAINFILPPRILRGTTGFTSGCAAFILGIGEQAEMAEENTSSEMDTQPSSEMDNGEQTTTNQDSPQGVSQEIEEMRKALKKANAEAAKYRKQASAYEEEVQARKEADMSEMEKLQAELQKTKAQAQQLQRETMQRQVAAKLGLPEPLALRLQGDSIEAMEEDAQSILDAMPKPATPKVNPTNPANGQPPGETIEERRRRIYSGGQVNSGSFDPVEAAKRGGGVVLPKGE